MSLVYSVILCLFLRTTLCQHDTDYDDFSINVTENITVKYGDCINIPYEITFPQRNVTQPYSVVLFSGTSTILKSTEKRGFLRLNCTMPQGEHEFGFRLEWGRNQSYTFTETVRISVLTKRPEVTMDNIIEGRTATLKCTAPYLNPHFNLEIPVITWKGANLTPVQPSRWGMRFSQPSSAVRITPKAEDHNTNITCQLRYKSTMVEKTVTLNVQYRPKILNSWCISKGHHTYCLCISQGNPRPFITWSLPSELICFSGHNHTVKKIVILQGSDHRNSTIKCISSNYLGQEEKNIPVQNPTDLPDITNLTKKLTNKASLESEHGLTLPWTITGVSICLSLAMFAIVICLYKKAYENKCNEEVNMYASLRGSFIEREYSNIPPQAP